MTSHPRVAVTGAAGFIGRSVTARLLADGCAVVAVVAARSASLPASVQQVELGRFAPETDFRRALEGCDAVVHLAARAHVMQRIDPAATSQFTATNVAVTRNLAAASEASGAGRFVFVSSIGVHGNATAGRPFTEADTPAPADPYARSKLEAEQALNAFRARLDVTILRPPLVYGPDAPGHFGRLLSLARTPFPLPLGAIHNKRSFVFVENLADLIARALTHPAAAGETFVVSDGEDLSTTELMVRMRAALGHAHARLIPVPPAMMLAAARLLGRAHLVEKLTASLQVDSTRARTRLGWVPPVSLSEGIRRSVR